MRSDTLAVRAGRLHHDAGESGERGTPHVPGIDLSTTYGFRTSSAVADSMDALVDGAFGAPNPVYARLHNPTVAGFEEALARLEGADGAVGFATGMAAISAVVPRRRGAAGGRAPPSRRRGASALRRHRPPAHVRAARHRGHVVRAGRCGRGDPVRHGARAARDAGQPHAGHDGRPRGRRAGPSTGAGDRSPGRRGRRLHLRHAGTPEPDRPRGGHGRPQRDEVPGWARRRDGRRRRHVRAVGAPPPSGPHGHRRHPAPAGRLPPPPGAADAARTGSGRSRSRPVCSRLGSPSTPPSPP